MRSRSRSPARSSSHRGQPSSKSSSRVDHRGDRDHHRGGDRSNNGGRDHRGSRRGGGGARSRSRSPPPARVYKDDFGRDRKPPPPSRDHDRVSNRNRNRSSPDRGSNSRRDDRGFDRSNRGDRFKDDRNGRRKSSRSPPPPRRSRARSGSSTEGRSSTKKDQGPPAAGAVPKFLLERPEITDKDLEGKTEEEQDMMKLMGFGGFETSKGKHVAGNDQSAVNVLQKRKYRQYMNRKGGFNRPLDFVA